MFSLLRGVLLACTMPVLVMAQSASPTMIPGIMKPAEVQKLLPQAVFFRGLSAPVQSRNSGGVLFSQAEGPRMMLAALVDTSGYSTSVQEKYQAYLLTEVALDIGGQRLPPGAYGCGFIAGEKFIVQDIGAHDLFTAPTTRDPNLRRPTPLQILAGPTPNEYRLYVGRSYVTIKAAS